MTVQIIQSYGELAASRTLKGRDPDVVARLLNEHGHKDDWLVLALEDWLFDDKDIEPHGKSAEVVHGRMVRETDGAVCVAIGRDECWFPKSQVTVFKRGTDAEIDIPQLGLTEFKTGGSA